MTRTAIHVDHIARVEGHGNVRVVIEDGIVKTVEMNVVEPARLFESMVRGRRFEEVPYIASRICGICSASHVVTDLLAIERVFGVEPTDRTRALRDLLVYGSYLQNHATHLFVFAAPDFLGMPSVFPLAETDPELFERALALKALGNELCTKVGGRSVHPITAVVGGFTHEIAAGEYRALADKMDEAREFAIRAVDLFRDFPVPAIETAGDMLAMVEEGPTRWRPRVGRASSRPGQSSTRTRRPSASRSMRCRTRRRFSRACARQVGRTSPARSPARTPRGGTSAKTPRWPRRRRGCARPRAIPS